MASTSATGNAPDHYTVTEALHIVYVHGFQGDHTSFQSFPSDLHHYLTPTIPKLQTWVYPTYKSAKPLSFAVSNLLSWMQSLPDGPIILCGHSMGGLLVAEAATNNSPASRRVIGVLAFDAPFLGMHPHVVFSGIASLFSKGGDKPPRTKHDNKSIEEKAKPAPSAEGMALETALNDQEAVTFVSSTEAYPKEGESPATTARSDTSSIHISIPPPRPKSPLLTLSNSSTTSNRSMTEILYSFLNNERITSYFQRHSDDPFVRWLNKHSDAPVAAMATWILERFEFGFAMFDYARLMDRYNKLETWDGDWVNFWTITKGEEDEEYKNWENFRPPTPKRKKMSKIVPFGSAVKDEFERAMKEATDKEEKRRSREDRTRVEKEKEQRIEKQMLETKMEEKTQRQKARLAKEHGEFMKEELESERERAKRIAKESESLEVDEEHSEEKENRSKYHKSNPELVLLIEEGDQVTEAAPEFAPAAPKPSVLSRPPTPLRDASYHFITLPGVRHEKCRNRWLKVRIEGVQDEVGAHCGLFIRGQNLEYDAFVLRVGELVKSWVA